MFNNITILKYKGVECGVGYVAETMIKNNNHNVYLRRYCYRSLYRKKRVQTKWKNNSRNDHRIQKYKLIIPKIKLSMKKVLLKLYRKKIPMLVRNSMANHMVMVLWIILMVIIIRESGSMGKSKGKESITILS